MLFTAHIQRYAYIEIPVYFSSVTLAEKFFRSLYSVKINKQKPHLKWSQEARQENSHSVYTTDPNRETYHAQIWKVK